VQACQDSWFPEMAKAALKKKSVLPWRPASVGGRSHRDHVTDSAAETHHRSRSVKEPPPSEQQCDYSTFSLAENCLVKFNKLWAGQ